MVKQVSFRSEAFSAGFHSALIWFLARMYALVDLQVLSLRKELATMRKHALERLGSVVQVHVSIQAYLPSELLAAPG